MLDVSVPSGFRSVVIVLLLRTFPFASLYTWDHGLKDGVTLQYLFHELNFSFLLSKWYFFFSSKCLCFLLSLNSSLFIVLWYSLNAFILFRIIVRLSVHQGTDFFFVLFPVIIVLKVLLHADCIASVNVCVYVRTYVCMCVCMYVYLCMCMYQCICVYMYVCMCVCIYVCVFMYVCMYMCVYLFIYICIYVLIYCVWTCVCMCVFMYVRGVVNKFPDWIFCARTECSYHTSR